MADAACIDNLSTTHGGSASFNALLPAPMSSPATGELTGIAVSAQF